MNASILGKLEQLVSRHEEVSALLSDPEVIGDQARFRILSQEYAQLDPVTEKFRDWQRSEEERREAEELLSEPDQELRELAATEIDVAKSHCEVLETELQRLLLPTDERDGSDIFMEIRAGTGGDEAALFAGDLFRMYSRYAETRGWQLEILNESHGEHGGYKEIIARIMGRDAFSRMKFESGAHRVQRIPDTESQGRIHTSAATVAILADVESDLDIEISSADLRVDTYRASGAGGQHVNKTDSAVRLTHLPSGIVVECQDQRSQHKNRARAMALLKAKLIERERSRQEAEQARERRDLVGSGDRSERIRTYNFPQGRVTDHRINLTLYKLGEVLQGDLDQVIDPLVQEHQADLLADLAAE